MGGGNSSVVIIKFKLFNKENPKGLWAVSRPKQLVWISFWRPIDIQEAKCFVGNCNLHHPFLACNKNNVKHPWKLVDNISKLVWMTEWMSAVSHALMRTGKFKCYDNALERLISCSRCMTGGNYDSKKVTDHGWTVWGKSDPWIIEQGLNHLLDKSFAATIENVERCQQEEPALQVWQQS
jgi:hypothetical protein